MKFFLALILTCLLVLSCEPDKKEPVNPDYASLPKEQREVVIKIDKEIDKLQNEMGKNMTGFDKEEEQGEGEVHGNWQKFSVSEKAASKNQQQTARIKERIIELQQKKIKILEDRTPQK